MGKIEEAVYCFNEGFMCSQAVLSTYGAQFGLDRETALKVSAAFGGGMGRMGETCGAVTGAFMVIGLKYGRTSVQDAQAHERTNDVVKEFVDEFKHRNGSILCRELLDCDLSTPKGQRAFKERNLRTSLCSRLVRDAADILERLLE